MLLTWLLTLFSLMGSFPAIALLYDPVARTTSSSASLPVRLLNGSVSG